MENDENAIAASRLEQISVNFHHKKIMAATSSEYVPVSQFFQNRSVFVTGGTGFMGKVLVEKLLRSCPGIKNIFLLIRPKRGQGIETRLNELINAPVSIYLFNV